MSFDPAWEAGYVAANIGTGQNGILYGMLDHYCQGRQENVLELGCGLGFNIRYWLERNADYRAIEGSATAVNAVHKMWPVLKERVVCADFTAGIPFTMPFDVIFDRAAVTHNNHSDIRRTLAHVYEGLKPGGLFVSCDWFSTSHHELEFGTHIDDEFTRTGYVDGVFRNIGRVHFSSRDEICELFSDFQEVMIMERIKRQELAGRSFVWAVWDLVFRKPK